MSVTLKYGERYIKSVGINVSVTIPYDTGQLTKQHHAVSEVQMRSRRASNPLKKGYPDISGICVEANVSVT